MLVSPVIHMESNHQQQQEPTHPKERSGTSLSEIKFIFGQKESGTLGLFSQKNIKYKRYEIGFSKYIM